MNVNLHFVVILFCALTNLVIHFHRKSQDVCDFDEPHPCQFVLINRCLTLCFLLFMFRAPHMVLCFFNKTQWLSLFDFKKK